MKIELITMWYNEEFLAPFFLNHYNWVDTIHILLDADTDDATKKIAASYPNVTIVPFTFPDMMDDIIKSRKINELYRTITDAEYIIIVDSDEFIFCNILDDSVKKYIVEKGKQVYFSTFWQVYQHEQDCSLDVNKPVYRQRRNGDPAIENCYIKPAIVRAGLDIVWGVGNHSIVLDQQYMSCNTPNAELMKKYDVTVWPADMLQGAHWKLFDLEETIRRRTKNRTDRQSRFNIATNLTYHHHSTTADDVIEEYNRMKLNPVVIKDRPCSTADDTKYRTIFEYILSESSFSDNHIVNEYIDGIDHLLEPCELPEWYALVQPNTAANSLADEMFQLAFEYYKNGDRAKAISVLQKALERSPDNFHYKFYSKTWQKNIQIRAK